MGGLNLCYGGLTLRSALRSLQVGGEGFLVQLWPTTIAQAKNSCIPKQILQVLEENQQVFQALPGLAPHRHYDRAIALQEGAPIPNLRPYRYPYY